MYLGQRILLELQVTGRIAGQIWRNLEFSRTSAISLSLVVHVPFGYFNDIERNVGTIDVTILALLYQVHRSAGAPVPTDTRMCIQVVVISMAFLWRRSTTLCKTSSLAQAFGAHATMSQPLVSVSPSRLL